jgi:UDP-N-acetylglucosamine 3-dehydrogenase
MSVSTIGIGLIGCGGMGRSLGRQLNQIEAARLVGITDLSAEAMAKAADELKAPTVPNIDVLLENPEVQAVLIATPPFEHRALAERAAARGKHLFVEKPMAANTADCDAILAAAEKAGVQLMIGQVLRFYPTWQKLLELVRAGEIGDPIAVSMTRIASGWGGWSIPWRNSLELSGGLLMELNAHEIDFMCQVCGDVTRVYAEADRYADDPTDYPNLYFVSMRFASGAVGLLHSSQVSAVQDISGKIQGTQGTIVYTNGFSPNGEIRYARRDGDVQRLTMPEIQGEQPVRHELRLFIEALQNGGPSPIPGVEGRRNVAIAEAAYESARTGQPVHL